MLINGMLFKKNVYGASFLNAMQFSNREKENEKR